MEENKILKKDSYISSGGYVHTIPILNDDELILEEYALIEEHKQEFTPQKITNQSDKKDEPINNQVQVNQPQVNQVQVNQSQVNIIICNTCKSTFWSMASYNLHWSCNRNLKCSYCCLTGHTITNCDTLNSLLKKS